MKLLITILTLSIVMVGCTLEELDEAVFADSEFMPRVANSLDIVILQSQINELKEHLGLVEWEVCLEKSATTTMNMKGEVLGTKYGECKKYDYYLTNDPLKVEWVELGCDNQLAGYDGRFCYDKDNATGRKVCDKEFYRCQELKELL